MHFVQSLIYDYLKSLKKITHALLKQWVDRLDLIGNRKLDCCDYSGSHQGRWTIKRGS
jgi:hypothetical protein